ncbi:MAG TPA: PspA/IM30 family protein [Candidatus Avilachnospira avistercoris]|nr:PspA/IM30 family protein [Candidatus Avilachnospira avistercoris]
MAGIFERMAMIAKSNVNDLLNKFEDPEKMVDQAIADATMEYAKIKEEALSVIANEKIAKKKLEGIAEEVKEWHGIASEALKAGNEDDARKALEKEGEIKVRHEAQKEAYESAKLAAEKVRDKLTEMEEEINAMKQKASEIKAKAVTAKAARAANSVSQMGIDKGAFEAFSRMEEKVESELAKAEALEDMSKDKIAEEAEDLKAKYKAGKADVDQALSDLKKELGL